MTDRLLTELLDRAAGSGKLPPGFAETVVSRSRARRRRRVAAAVGALAAVVAAGAVVLPRLDDGGGPPAPVAPASRPEPAVLVRLNQNLGTDFTADEMLATGVAGNETLVAIHRFRTTEEGKSGKEAAIFVDPPGGRFYRASDYITYDSSCFVDDAVCEEIRSTGLGMYVVRVQPGGREFVFVQAPAGRRVEVDGRPLGDTSAGAVTEIPAARTDDVQVRVTLPDGRRYRIPNVPSSTVDRRPPD